MDKVVLAYSGGLDTSIIIPYLKETYHLEVVACTVNLGQKVDPKRLKDKALKSGAAAFYFEDLRETFIKEYIFPALAANALYQGKYPLATSLSRPLIAKKVVEVAKRVGARYLSHGCTGKGNDQVRFELAWKVLAPDLKIIAPLREWQFKTREEEIEFAKKRGIPVPVTKKSPYSIDENLWGISIECGVLEDPAVEPPEDAYQLTVSPQKAPEDPFSIEIAFEKGIPISLNGKKVPPVELILRLNRLGAKYGVGRIDMVEDRTVGLKSREIYEAPAATVLITSHQELEKMVLSRSLLELKDKLSSRYAWLVYQGAWFSEEREALDAFFAITQRYVTGKVRVRLYKGTASVVGRQSPYSLYEETLATYGVKDLFDRTAAKGFIDLLGLPLLLEGRRRSRK